MFRHCILVAALLLTNAAGVRSATSYTIIDVGSFRAGDSVEATGINDSGIVVGADRNQTTVTAFYWDGSLHPLSPLAGDSSSGANAVNSLGWITGQSFTSPGQRGALWVNGLPSLLPVTGNSINPLSINTAGSIVGSFRSGSSTRAFYLPAGASTSVDLGTLGGGTASASAINDNGTIVGSADTANGNSRPFIWHSGQMTQLSDLGLSGAAYCINQQNVAGGWVLRANFTLQPALWAANGTRTALPALAGSPDAEVWGVNQNLEAVGDADGQAVLWSGGTVQKLLTLIPADAGWTTLNYAFGINSSGEIVGWGTRDNTGTDHAFLLVPVPEPAGLMHIGLIVLAWRLRRGRVDQESRMHFNSDASVTREA